MEVLRVQRASLVRTVARKIGRKEDRGWEHHLGLDLGKRTAKSGAASCVIATEAARKRFQGRCLHGWGGRTRVWPGNHSQQSQVHSGFYRAHSGRGERETGLLKYAVGMQRWWWVEENYYGDKGRPTRRRQQPEGANGRDAEPGLHSKEQVLT